ncbi:hypothetical protein GCK72_007347 [Caenorhabditis remanei]|uniref:Uncharacterized protein n=1 Tax=Caenorhabditis remanei TaxID=31234 RepID=A0A6A5HHR1_CAERE|nr:hypothetical protein GCK72_007347 [Caenorhabditis remanei]KAF1767388.1 hypothetical protein GCK72_007347 [Caenorhabditis remanei]
MAPVPIDLSKINYRALLRHNLPGGGPFLGTRFQRGGNMRGAGLGGILTAALTLIPRFLNSRIGQHLIKAGKELATELVNGNPIKESVKTVAKRKLKEFAGSGKKRRLHLLEKSIKAPSIAVLKPHLVKESTRTNFL